MFRFLLTFLFLFTHQMGFAEGFQAGTLVKTPQGYIPIEELKVGSIVTSCDFLTPCVDRAVVATESHVSERPIQIIIDGQVIITDQDHQLYSQELSEFFSASELDFIALDEEIELFNLSIEGTHNYYITTSDILVHNFSMTLTRAVAPVAGPLAPAIIAVGAAYIVAENMKAMTEDAKKQMAEAERRRAQKEAEDRSRQENERRDREAREQKQREEAKVQTPDTSPDSFNPVKGSKAKINKKSGEVWEKDLLHKDHWEVYKNKKDWEKGTRDRAVWSDGRLKKKF